MHPLASLSRTPTQKKARKPTLSSHISFSSFRPHVPAADRLSHWLTPFGIEFHLKAAHDFSAVSTNNLVEVMLTSLEPNTRKNYGAGLLRFTQFCDLHNIPEDSRMPAADALLATFVAEWNGKVARTTVDSWVAGLSAWHTVNSAPWLGSKMLRMSCKAALKAEPEKGEKRPPITLEHLYALRERLDLSNTFDAAVYAVACVAFWCCRR